MSLNSANSLIFKISNFYSVELQLCSDLFLMSSFYRKLRKAAYFPGALGFNLSQTKKLRFKRAGKVGSLYSLNAPRQ